MITLLLATPPVVIDHVRVEVGDGSVIEDTNVVLSGDMISAVKVGANAPGAHHIDGHGKTLAPGFIDVLSQLGVVEVELEKTGRDDQLEHAPFVPAFSVADGFNPLSMRIPIAREEGITSSVVSPRGGVLYGMGYWFELTGLMSSRPDVKTPLAMFGGIGSEAAENSGGARGGIWMALREIIADTRFYAQHRKAVEEGKARPLSLSPMHLEAMIPVVEGKLPLVLRASRASDIMSAIVLAQNEKIKIMIAGANEAWLVANELKAAQIPVIIKPTDQVPWGLEAARSRDDLATLLAAAGVEIIIASDDSSQRHRRLRQEAGTAVAYGLSHAAALRAITETPARLFGHDKEVGTVKVGKRANVVLWSGDPLETTSYVLNMWIGGESQNTTTRQLLLVKRYRAI